jgi:hypothetical protein
MKWYAAIDLHSNNTVTVVMDEHDHVVYQQRVANELAVILQALAVYQAACTASQSSRPRTGTGWSRG